MQNQSEEKPILNAIEEALSLLGESAKQAIYYHLEKDFGIPKQQIPDRIDDFSRALKAIFGEGASYIENVIHDKLIELNR